MIEFWAALIIANIYTVRVFSERMALIASSVWLTFGTISLLWGQQ